MSILQKQARLVAEFQALPDMEERYKRIIARGRTLRPMDEALKTEDNKVRGCASSVWLHAHVDQGTVRYAADSDALITKGLIALVLEVYDGESPGDILRAPPAFIEELGLNVILTPNRANGLTAMVRQVKNYALAFHTRANRERPTEITPPPGNPILSDDGRP
jgi:cysteine desulfuration protein SufE